MRCERALDEALRCLLKSNSEGFKQMDRAITAELKIEELKALLTEVLDWLNNAPISYSNGNIWNGLDEGDVIGGRMHNELVEKIKTALAH